MLSLSYRSSSFVEMPSSKEFNPQPMELPQRKEWIYWVASTYFKV